MKKLVLDSRHDDVRYRSYVIGFLLSIAATLVAYLFVVNNWWPKETLVYFVMGIAVVQLVVQAVFFLHIGRGNQLKLVTFLFAILVVLIIVIGTIWIMENLNYNMMHMSPEEMHQYMKDHEGI